MLLNCGVWRRLLRVPWTARRCNQSILKEISPGERLLLTHKKMLGFLASRGEEFNPGPEMRLDRSEILCNKELELQASLPCPEESQMSPQDERLLLNHERHQDSWPPEEKNSIQGQRQGLIAQSFCVIKFYLSIKEIEKASDIGIRRGQKE